MVACFPTGIESFPTEFLQNKCKNCVLKLYYIFDITPYPTLNGAWRRTTGCVQKSAYVHAKNVLKIFLLEVILFVSIIFACGHLSSWRV